MQLRWFSNRNDASGIKIINPRCVSKCTVYNWHELTWCNEDRGKWVITAAFRRNAAVKNRVMGVEVCLCFLVLTSSEIVKSLLTFLDKHFFPFVLSVSLILERIKLSRRLILGVIARGSVAQIFARVWQCAITSAKSEINLRRRIDRLVSRVIARFRDCSVNLKRLRMSMTLTAFHDLRAASSADDTNPMTPCDLRIARNVNDTTPMTLCNPRLTPSVNNMTSTTPCDWLWMSVTRPEWHYAICN